MAGSSPTSSPRNSFVSEFGSFDIGDTKVQMSGILVKKPFGGKKGKKGSWQKRFFIAKDCFLLYYAESECRAFQKDHHFNIHPKGVIPLGSCKIEECVDGSQKFAIRISHSHFKGEIVVGAESPEECSSWVKVLKDCAKVTWRNAQIGESVIEKLEEKGKEMAQERQEMIDKLKDESSKLEEQQEKQSELEKLAVELEGEKKAIEMAAKNLRDDKDTTELELKSTLTAMKEIEAEKSVLYKQTKTLQSNLQSVSQEQEKTAAQLAEQMEESKRLDAEKKRLEEETNMLQADLESLAKLKEMAAMQLAEQEKLSKQFQEEKKLLEDATNNLKTELQVLENHKKILENEKLTTEERYSCTYGSYCIVIYHD
ncbi:PREDICTED: pleckstrin homology domain-containing family D member 1-like isoform X2 [Amphimedon queenslandica]|uniref:PH domain-containing protein n=1 Tax=Amphimedon queenslandica TaxID=400682 RepID=A0AAN0JAE9_AMPQE|nr:PREDICTED: pleckstrin homology domain-containing family D member 1-like isoform X2 [Amphimedon queenslandica]|eukprot:XP_019853711.1 PREDICTED: pleckstrin homology domain-containing family D member 1-like isoform X2 [Amphimedon queenslandica]